jgi:glycosyltransferase involved in cell wall biosynthesis
MPNWWYWQGAEALWGALLAVAKTKGVRGIFSTSSDGDIRPRTALMRRQRWWPLYAWGLNNVERIFVQHHGQLSGLNGKLRAKTNVVPGLVSTREGVKPRSERRNHVAWVAFLREQKRPDLLIEIARRTPEVKYVVCGATTTYLARPGYGDGIVKQLQSLPNVEYLGHTSASEALDIMGNAAALLCTSELEGFPNTFLEAWSVGTPVVTLNIDPGGVIQERNLGFVSRTQEQAATDIRRLLRSPQTFDAVSTAARRYVEDVHSDAAVAAIFNNAIGA